MGFCPQCRSQGSMAPVSPGAGRGASLTVQPIAAVATTGNARTSTGIQALDRVLGGGLVAGAAVLLAGEPGVGKSTLLLQLASAMASGSRPALVASAEESVEQIALRGRRVQADERNVLLLASSDIDDVIATAESMTPSLVVVDSIQTVGAAVVDGAAGGVGQVRECAARAIRYAKRSGVPVLLVGHVTKDGAIAGPRMLEHMVDVALYTEGDPQRGLRVVRGLKNRFGPVNEVGFFD